MAMNSARHTQFQDRLKRISAGGPNTIGQVYVGPTDTSGDKKSRKKRSTSGRDALDNVLYPISLIGAFAMGAFAVLIARLARFYLLEGGLTGENADLWMIVDGVVALGVVISLRSVFRTRGKVLEVTKAIGIIVTILTMHMFVHLMPGAFTSAFSQNWTNQVIATTKSSGLLLPGQSLTSKQPAFVEQNDVAASPAGKNTKPY